MRCDWQTASVTELEKAEILLVQDGNHGEYRPRREELNSEGTPHIRAADISDVGVIDFAGAQRINDVALARIRKGVGAPGDVLLTHKGTVGRVARAPLDAPPFVCSPQTTFWRSVAPDRLDQGFLFAFLRSPAFEGQLRSRMHESDMAPYVSLTAQRSFLVPLPPIEVQRRIASVLTALDDKIDSNRRLAKLLEEAAATLFKARFVDFVGIEEFEESEIGLRPRGWRVGRLADFVAQRKDHCRPSGETAALPYVPIDVIPARSFMQDTYRPGEEARSSLTTFEAGDVLFGAMRPYFHKVAIAPFRGTTRTTVFVFRPVRPEDWAYTALLLSQDTTVEFATRSSRGSTIPYAVWNGVLSEMPVVVPPPDERVRFCDVGGPLLASIQNMTFEQQALVQIRDLLLPKLISGEIRVPDTTDPEEVIGPAAEQLAGAAR